MRTIGIDPGATGALAYFQNGALVDIMDIPMEGSDLRAWYLWRQVSQRWSGVDYIAIERVEQRPKQSGVVSMISNYGRLLAVCEIAFPTAFIEFIPSKAWQKPLLLPKDVAARKRAYTATAAQKWPGFGWYGPRGGLRDGRAAAALIGDWAGSEH